MDTARQGESPSSLIRPVVHDLFYPEGESFPLSVARHFVTGLPFQSYPRDFVTLAKKVQQNSNTSNYDVLNFILMSTQTFQSLLTFRIVQAFDNRNPRNLIRQWGDPKHLALDLVTQTTDPTRRVQLRVAPRSKALCDQIFRGQPPELDMLVDLSLQNQPRPTKHLHIQAKPGNNSPVSRNFLDTIFEQIALPDVAVHLNRR